MSPEEHYLAALAELGLPGCVYHERLASFRQALLEHDVEVIEDFLYGEPAEGYIGGTDADGDSLSQPVRMTAARRYGLGL